MPGTKLPYVVHLSNVVMEILVAALYTEEYDLDFAVQVALLHDIIEDTATTYDELAEHFGSKVADGVLALTKNKELPAERQNGESLERIQKLQKEVWAVKLADRITTLQPPPFTWNKKKISEYREEASLILHTLKGGNKYLAERLEAKINFYDGFILDDSDLLHRTKPAGSQF